MYKYLIVIYLALLVSILRFTLPVTGQINKQDIYKDLAHLFVGGVFGSAIETKDRWLWIIAGSLTVLEVIAFIIRKT
jgi:hypothetical protein